MLSADVVQGFSQSMLQKNYDAACVSPHCHYEWWTYFGQKHPQVAIAAPRGHAKSTALTFAWTMAHICFREFSYIVIVSDTVTQAIQFLGDMKKEFAENETMRSLFKIDSFLKESEDDIIVRFTDGAMFRIQAKGSGQAMRGMKWNQKRPDLILCDDLENDEIVMNKDRRDKFRRWFYGALLPCKAVHGVVRYVGTILHTDSMLESVMPKPYQKDTVVDGLKTWHTKRRPWLSVKYKAHNEDYSEILWPERFDKQFFKDKRQEYVDQGYPDVYSMEFLNIPIDESVAYFKRKDLLPMDKEDRQKVVKYYITGDLAISKEDTADYSVFVVAAVDEDKMLYIKDVVRERMDGREIVDTILELEHMYKPEIFGLEEMQVTKAIGPFLNEEMVRTGIFPNLMKLKHAGKDKLARARSIQARVRAHGVKFNKAADWYQAFEDEIASFPRSKHDDQVDAFAYLGMMLQSIVEAPTRQEIEDELYADEYEQSGLGDGGRSAHTGY